MNILGIETSCDDMCAAVVADGTRVLSNVSRAARAPVELGGIVPELAAREVEAESVEVLKKALDDADINDIRELDLIAVTRGPGLPGSLRVGVNMARALSVGSGVPLLGVHHIAGHMAALRIAETAPMHFPALVLTASGGHTEFAVAREDFSFEVVGKSRDDAAGEAFDKVSKMLGMGFPGGPAVSALAEKGDPNAFALPRPMLKSGCFDVSFAGLKTAVKYAVRDANGLKNMSPQARADLAASFQHATAELLTEKLFAAARAHDTPSVGLTGGVAANGHLRRMVAARAQREGLHCRICAPKFCGDNAAMIAAAAHCMAAKNGIPTRAQGLSTDIFLDRTLMVGV